MATTDSTRRTAEYLRLIFRQTPGVVWATDRELRLTYVQGRTVRIDETMAERMVGTTVYEFLGTRDPTEPGVAHHLAALAGGNQAFSYVRGDRWFEVVIEPLRDAVGTIIGCVGAAIDVTRQRETTKWLERSVSMLEATLDASEDGILVFDRAGRVTAQNRRFRELWRVPPPLIEQGNDRGLLSFLANQLEDPKAFADRMLDVDASAGRAPADVLRFTDGRVFEGYSMPQLVGDAVVGRVWTFQDVSERERLLKRATFLADATRLLASLDIEKALRGVAHLAVPYLGERCAIDLIRDGAPERIVLLPPDDGADRVPEIHPAALGGHALIYGAAGRSHLSVPLICREKVTGAVTFVAPRTRRYTTTDLDVVKDLAGRAALSIDNARLYEGAREALASRDEFLSIAAHEIRGPLTSIHLAVQGLLRESLPPDAARTVLEVIEREDRRLGRFVDELLDLSRIRTGQLHFEIEEVDAGTVVRDVVSHLSGQVAHAHSTVSVTTRGALVGHWDRMRLEQVVTNLLSNAIKYANGEPIEITAEKSDSRVRIKVVDHGPGIEPALLPKLFDPFERGTQARHFGGLGLGLHISKVIVDGLGGTLTADSRPGEGAAFTVELPIARSPEHV